MGETDTTRRRYLQAVGLAGMTGLAGCGDTSTLGISEDTREAYQSVAIEGATQLGEWRETRRETTRRLSESNALIDGGQENVQSFLQSASETLPEDIFDIHYTNLDMASIVASTDRTKIDTTLNTREAPWQHSELEYGDTGVFVSTVTEALGMSLLSFVSPVDTADSRTMALVIQTNVDVVATNRLTAPDGGDTSVVTGDGDVVATSERPDDLARNDGALEKYRYGADSQMVQRGLAGESGFVDDLPANGEATSEKRQVAAFAPVSGVPWVVITHVPFAEAVAA